MGLVTKSEYWKCIETVALGLKWMEIDDKEIGSTLISDGPLVNSLSSKLIERLANSTLPASSRHDPTSTTTWPGLEMVGALLGRKGVQTAVPKTEPHTLRMSLSELRNIPVEIKENTIVQLQTDGGHTYFKPIAVSIDMVIDLDFTDLFLKTLKTDAQPPNDEQGATDLAAEHSLMQRIIC